MSYARFSADSSVYVFLSVGGFFDCCGCLLLDESEDNTFADTASMLAHLERHKAAGHAVPDYAIERLKEQQVDNDAWIAEERASTRSESSA